ncbi:hypothetical protein [Actinacidiphila oryziradicis]|uniref:hypothetical protein n=1 Tax=Actinacidiphila oryziradicis TaxID=2571141 RepID=UPI0023F076D7|nr:hypothetical protein [Actinacidiphila oryziradicis]MCW2873514.1 hypothetical protein [Actinacidiphila oryziradicis]
MSDDKVAAYARFRKLGYTPDEARILVHSKVEPDVVGTEDRSDDDKAAYARFLELGCTPEDANTLVRAGVEPNVVGANAPSAVPFVGAALYHDLDDINGRLEATGGDGEAAWQEWADENERNGWEG